MASNINYINIDESFPVAGQDNDTQGFRDNFSTIKSSLASAKTEITDLQENTAKLNANNNFNQSEISNAKFRNNPAVYYSTPTLSNPTAPLELDITDGHYQIININGTASIDLGDFKPATGAQVAYQVRLLINNTATSNSNVLWVTGSPSNIFRVNSTWPKRVNPSNLFIVEPNQPVLVDIWTTDGIIFYGHYHGSFAAVATDVIPS